jgi:hypothetical protein
MYDTGPKMHSGFLAKGITIANDCDKVQAAKSAILVELFDAMPLSLLMEKKS